MLLFTAATFNLPQTPVTNEEIQIKKKMKNMLQQMYEEKFEIDKDSLDFQNSLDTKIELVTNEEGNEVQEVSYYIKEMIHTYK